MNDSFIVSLLKGRIGAGVLSLIALVLSYYGMSLSEGDQAKLLDSLVVIATAGSSIYAFLSKLREGKKTKRETNGKS